MNFENNLVKFVPLKVRDDKDVETMLVNHEFSGFNYIDLYIRFELCQQYQVSHIFNEPKEESPNVIPIEDVEEEDREENEA